MVGSATEEEAKTAGGTEGEKGTRKVTTWGTEESGTGEIHGEAWAGRGNTGKSPSASANEVEREAAMG